MRYHIDTGLIIEKFSTDCRCPLCEIKKIVEEQFLHEFLNDAVMEDNTRIKVGKKGFCARHFDMLFSRQNKLSLALQIETRLDKLAPLYSQIKSAKAGTRLAKKIEQSAKTCAICELTEESMVKYYKTVAQLFYNEKEFCKILIKSSGFCMEHYAKLLQYSKYAGGLKDSYVEVLSGVQNRTMFVVKDNIHEFCIKHDYRNALKPLGSAENALPDVRAKLYGEKIQ